MGRRKIEIQPITHERNRSVTFLKRKNGLFKKAYELGVLCSVDVAVIIFEERPGHHVKLYQYGSSDIHDIVQRHLRHDGEKDTRGPPDFSGNNSSKLDDVGDDDGDDDDDEDLPSRKRRQDGKLKPTSDMATGNVDYTSPAHRSLSIPQPPPLSLHGIGSQSGAGGRPTLPLSDSRSMDMRDNKRGQRLSLHPGHSRSPSDDVNPGNGNYPYYTGQNSGNFNRPQQYGGHHSSHGSGHHSNAQYQPFFPVSGTHTSPPPSFIPLQSEFSRGPSSRGGGGGSGPGFGLGSSRGDNMPYPGMLRTQGSNTSQTSGPGGSGGGNDNLFAAFLDADEQSRHQNHSNQGPGLVGLDWPVHNTGGNGPGGGGGGGGGSSAPSGPSSSVSNLSPTPSSTLPNGPHGGNWLDFLSGNNPNAPSPPNGREAMSWERGGGGGGGGGGNQNHRGSIPDIFGGGSERGRVGNNSGSSGSMIVGISGKRGKMDEDPGFSNRGGMLASPASLNERLSGDFKKDILKDGS